MYDQNDTVSCHVKCRRVNKIIGELWLAGNDILAGGCADLCKPFTGLCV